MHIELKLVHWKELFKIVEIKMKHLIFFSITLSLLFPTKMYASKSSRVKSVCQEFAAGKIDAINTLKALDININDFSIGITNAAKIFCA